MFPTSDTLQFLKNKDVWGKNMLKTKTSRSNFRAHDIMTNKTTGTIRKTQHKKTQENTRKHNTNATKNIEHELPVGVNVYMYK